MKSRFKETDKHYDLTTGKLHVSCPHREKTGVNIHVVIKGGNCYRSDQCMVVWCKFNRHQNDIDTILSVLW